MKGYNTGDIRQGDTFNALLKQIQDIYIKNPQCNFGLHPKVQTKLNFYLMTFKRKEFGTVPGSFLLGLILFCRDCSILCIRLSPFEAPQLS